MRQRTKAINRTREGKKLAVTTPDFNLPGYDIEYLLEIDYWIDQAGNTLEAYVMVPRLYELLDTSMYEAIQWLRTNYRWAEWVNSGGGI